MTTFLARVTGTGADRPLEPSGRPVSGWAFTGLAVVPFGGPLAAAPGLAGTGLPGMTAAELFAGHGFAVAIGVGVAVSIAGVMLAEYLALSRLVTAAGGCPPGG